MDARVAVPLGILGAAFLLPLVFAPAIFFAWSLTFAGLYLLAREPVWRRGARVGLASFAILLLLCAIGAGIVVGWRGERLVSGPTIPGAGGWASLLMVSGILATGIALALAPDARTRGLARIAGASALVLLVVLALVASGERIGGLIGLFGAVTLALVAAALFAALRASSSPSPSP